MREMDRQDDQPALGKKVVVPPPEPQPKHVSKDGEIRQGPDGKFYTHIPNNEFANWPGQRSSCRVKSAAVLHSTIPHGGAVVLTAADMKAFVPDRPLHVDEEADEADFVAGFDLAPYWGPSVAPANGWIQRTHINRK